MAVSITLNLGGVEGESAFNSDVKPSAFADINKIKGKAGRAIDVLSWSWGVTQSGSAHLSTGASSGTADVADLTITKYVDMTSPLLIQNCFNGVNHGGAILTCWKTSDKLKLPYMQVKMGDVEGCEKKTGIVYISSVQTGAQGDGDRLIETVSFNFNRFETVYVPQKNEQEAAGALQYGYLSIASK